MIMDFHEAYSDTCSTVGMAARMGNLDALKQLLQNGKPADVKDNRGWFPTHEAASEGHTACLDLILKQDCVDVNLQSYEGETALLLACRQAHVSCVQKLIENGADINLATNEQVTPLHEAITSPMPGSQDCSKLLLEAGCHVNCQDYTGETELYKAVEWNKTDILKPLFQRKADICLGDENGLTPVFVASMLGHAECLKILLEEAKHQGKTGVVNMTAEDNASPLLIACQKGHAAVVELLLEAGADPTLEVVVDKDESHSMDALQYAVKFNNERCLQLILQHDSRKKPQKYKVDYYHPLMLAIDHKDIGCLKLLIDHSFDRHPHFKSLNFAFNSILTQNPSYKAAQYILHKALYLINRNALDTIIATLTNKNCSEDEKIKLIILILSHAVGIESLHCQCHFNGFQEMAMYEQFLHMEWFFTSRILFLLIKHGCKNVAKWIEELNWALYKRYSSVLLFTPVLSVQNMVKKTQDKDPQTAKLMSQIEADSHTLRYASRVAIIRQMISVDQWGSETVERLGLPLQLVDYLKFKEYGALGEEIMTVMQTARDHLKRLTAELELESEPS